jgi:hypothetical protein
MAPKRALCSIGVDVDAVAGWLGSYGGEDSPNDISRGMFAGEVGVPRMLKLFDKYDMSESVSSHWRAGEGGGGVKEHEADCYVGVR